MLLFQILTCTIYGKNMKVSNKSNKFKITAATWNEKNWIMWWVIFCIRYIQDYFEYSIKKHEAVSDNSPKRKYVYKIENRIIFKIKTRHYPQLWMPEAMKLLWSTKNKTTKDNICHLEIEKVKLAHCSIVTVNNVYHLS